MIQHLLLMSVLLGDLAARAAAFVQASPGLYPSRVDVAQAMKNTLGNARVTSLPFVRLGRPLRLSSTRQSEVSNTTYCLLLPLLVSCAMCHVPGQ